MRRPTISGGISRTLRTPGGVGAPPSWRRRADRPLGVDGEGNLDPGVLEEGELLDQCAPPRGQLLVEVRAVAFLGGVLELVEGGILGVEQLAVLQQEVVVDGLRHAGPPAPGADRLPTLTVTLATEPSPTPGCVDSARARRSAARAAAPIGGVGPVPPGGDVVDRGRLSGALLVGLTTPPHPRPPVLRNGHGGGPEPWPAAPPPPGTVGPWTHASSSSPTGGRSAAARPATRTATRSSASTGPRGRDDRS